MKKTKIILYAILILCGLSKSSFPEEYNLVHGVIHLDSNISGGDMSLEEMLILAQNDGMKYAIFTDHDTMRWEYGLSPLKKVIRKVIEKGSVQKYGPENYVKDIEKLDEDYKDIIALSGAEAIPFYYWEGSYFKGDLALMNGHEHLIVFGFENVDDYANLPSIGHGYPRKFTNESLVSLWPIAFFVLGFILLFTKRIKDIKTKKAVLKKSISPWKIPAIACLVLGALFFYNNVPFSFPLYDQYHGKQGIGPFQHLIDYVNSRNGLVFWAHPEVKNDWYDDSGGIKIKTDAYYKDLLTAHNYTGYAVFAEGINYIAPPMGIWDQVLLEYCSGRRKRPVWALGEVDFEANTFSIKDTQTVLLLKETNKESILNALRVGRMYAIHLYTNDAPTLYLNEFTVESFDSIELAYMCEDIIMDANPTINIKISSDRENVDFKVELIRNGKIIKTYNARDSININFDDDYYEPGKKIFYRLDITGPCRIISNPVFVEFM